MAVIALDDLEGDDPLWVNVDTSLFLVPGQQASALQAASRQRSPSLKWKESPWEQVPPRTWRRSCKLDL